MRFERRDFSNEPECTMDVINPLGSRLLPSVCSLKNRMGKRDQRVSLMAA
jgi:hypothetical protein